MNIRIPFPRNGRRIRQQGVTTLAITLILLVIITLMVIFSTNVGFFEQKTTTNENRARISQQAAEYALNMGGEYLKANRDRLIANTTAEGGWLAPSTAVKWVKCVDVGGAGAPDAGFPTGHPCLSERDPNRRKELYFFTRDGTTGGDQTMPYLTVMPANVNLETASVGTGGASNFATTTSVRALLCRLDTSDPTKVACKLDPVAGNRVALTLIADSTLGNENGAAATVKATWGSYSAVTPSAAVPLIGSGFITGLGNGQIVANPDSQSNGSNLMASIWSPNHVDRGGSYITCNFSEFTGQLGGTEWSMDDVKTDCPALVGKGSSPPCNCPKSPDENRTSKEDWSGHGTGGGGTFHTGNDVLDVAAGEPICDSTINLITANCRTLPSITFFPGPNGAGTPMDRAGVEDDDSIFEYVFGVKYVVPDQSTDANTLSNCGSGAQNCFDYAMREEFSATILPDCSSLGPSSSGIYYVTGPCDDLSKKTIGSVDSPAIVVINQGTTTLKLGQDFLMYGLLFVHSDTNKADVTGNNPQIYGSLVVEGDIKMTGQFTIVYDDTSASGSTNKIPKSARFALVPGSWLDARTSF